ncbi:S-layer homology domain-containing protein [Paenibacillus sp. GCM10027627]|uniref:NHL domain-containing protein n=1 Tax=unclassified Paenibacillus TaxID=185978 RepID=UPI0036307D95
MSKVWKKSGIVILAMLIFISGLPGWMAGGGTKAYAASSTGWESLGPPGFTEDVVNHSSFFVEDGVPYIAFSDYLLAGKVTVMKYTGVSGGHPSGWELVGRPGFSEEAAADTSLYVESGQPYVAFVEQDANQNSQVVVMSYVDDGSGTPDWRRLGQTGITSGAVDNVSISSNDGSLIISYQEDGKGFIRFYEPADDVWKSEPSDQFSGDASQISLYVNGSGYPVVAYSDGDADGKVTVKKADRYGDWATIGDAGFTDHKALEVSMSVESGVYYVAYTFEDDNGSPTLAVMKYNSRLAPEEAKWEMVGVPGLANSEVKDVSLAVDNGVPYVAYRNMQDFDEASVMRFVGISPAFPTGWALVGSSGFTDRYAFSNKLVAEDGKLYLASLNHSNWSVPTVMTYTLQDYSLGELAGVGLNPLPIGYASGTQETKTVQLTQMGRGELTGVAVSISGEDADLFTITPLTSSTLNDSIPFAHFTVTAVDGLPAGTYKATLKVSSDQMADIEFAVMQIVTDMPKTIISIVGKGGRGYSGDGGAGVMAQLRDPEYLFVDDRGNVYISDTRNHVVRKFNPVTGIINTIAGNGEEGYSGDDGPATEAQLNSPRGIVVDVQGNVYIADSENGRVRMVDAATGTISTVAGSGQFDYMGDGGPATDAGIDGPSGVALDRDGNLYIVDTFNSAIRKVNSEGIISTVAGNGDHGYAGDGRPATEAQFDYPRGIVIDDNGNMYIADYENDRIRKVDGATGLVSTVAGIGEPGFSGDGGPATAAQLDKPEGLALDSSGNLLIADTENDRIRVVNGETGSILTYAGSGNESYSGEGIPAIQADLNTPIGVATDSNGNVYIADNDNHRVRKLVDAAYSVTYDGNGSTEGSIPAGGVYYEPGATVHVHDNSGTLAKTGFTFSGWNTKADGTGTGYTGGSTFAMGTSNTTLFAKWPSPGGSSGGGVSTPQPEKITVNVEDGKADSGSVVSTAVIERTTLPNGQKRDNVVFNAEQAGKTVDQLKAAGSDSAVIVIPDSKDEVAELNVSIPKASAELLAKNKVNLELQTRNARIMIPIASLQGASQDFYFRLVPIKQESERKEVERRAILEQAVKAAAGEEQVSIVGRPMTIETNMQSRQVTLVLPLGDHTLSEAELKELGVYIEHSDGTKELIKGEVVPYDGKGQRGLQFTVNKFSTFAIVHIEGWKSSSPNGSAHKAYLSGYPNGEFRPENGLTRAELASILARLFDKEEKQPVGAYTDVKTTHWAKAAIVKATAMGLMVGYPDGSFRPEAKVSRAELASVASRLVDLGSEGSGKGFADTEGHWAQAFIAKAQAAGIVNGYKDGTFRPNKKVSRAEAAVVFNGLLDRGPLTGAEPKWRDVPKSHWAYGHILEASTDHAAGEKTAAGEVFVPLK